MSGHSKWSKVKHQKASTDVVKGREFTKASRAIIVAVHEGGNIADPEKNFRLRLAIDKARAVNMPKETIERAIAHAAGENSDTIHEVSYEAYGPGGIALIIEAATDKKQRTVSEVKNVLDRHGGVLAAQGAVSYLFHHVGLIIVQKSDPTMTFDSIVDAAIASGADDVREMDECYEIICHMDKLHSVKSAIQSLYPVDSAHIVFLPKVEIETDEHTLGKLELLIEALENLDDIQNIYTNSKG